MRKISLLLLACFISILHLVGQTDAENNIQYKKKKIDFNEAKLLSSFYTQNGNNSAVTGGKGTEKLTDFSNQFDISIVLNTAKGNKNIVGAACGIDYYTSASSDNIEPVTNVSSASYDDLRIYPSVNYRFENVNKDYDLGVGLYYSTEFDYKSIGVNGSFSKSINNKNTRLGGGFNLFFDKVSVIRPIELREYYHGSLYQYPIQDRRTYAFDFILHQVLSKKTQMALNVNPVIQNGFLSTPFNRVINTSGQSSLEVLPDSRVKLPIGFRVNYLIADKYALRSFYRFYIDNWGIFSNTIEEEIALPVSKKVTFLPSFRFYQQTGSKYFFPYGESLGTEEFRTSDYDLSSFISLMPGLTFRLADSQKLWVKPLSSFELKYGFYHRTNGLNAHILSMLIRLR